MSLQPQRHTRPYVGTLGMFIIDTFSFEEAEGAVSASDHGLGEQIGGGGTYFSIGSRIFLDSSKVIMVIDRGADFPSTAQVLLETMALPGFVSTTDVNEMSNNLEGTLWHFRNRTGHTTRAINIYRGDHRGFEYLTAKIRLEPIDLVVRPAKGADTIPSEGILPLYLHMICSPERALQICDQVSALDRQATDAFDSMTDIDVQAWMKTRTRLVWEPIPDSAVFDNLAACLEVMQRIDVFSPNHEEAASFLGLKLPEQALDREYVQENLAREFAQRSTGKQPVICIRSGALGAVFGKSELGWQWVDAWHTPEEAAEGAIVDVTGAGNAFLGGFTASLATQEVERADPTAAHCSWTIAQLAKAATCGSVAASFVIEQFGLPSFRTQYGVEKWNGRDTAASRMKRLLSE